MKFLKQYIMRLFILSILIISSGTLQAQQEKLLSFFDQYSGKDGFTTVYITPKMFSLFSDIDSNDEEFNDVAEAVSMLKGIRILVMDSVGSLTYNPLKMYDEVARVANNIQYEDLMIVKDGNTDVKFMIRENAKVIEELLLLVGDTDQFVFISLMGNIDLKKLSSLSQSMDVEGLDYLDQLNAKY